MANIVETSTHGAGCIGCKDDFVSALALRLRVDFAELTRELDDAVLDQRIRASVARALAWGLTSHASIAEYVLLSLGLGPGFVRRFRVREHLSGRQDSPDERILSLRTYSHPNCWFRQERRIVDEEWQRLLADDGSRNHPEVVLCGEGEIVLRMPAQLLPAYGFSLDVPYVETPDHEVQAMLEVARVERADTVMDLGCGDGRIAIAAARKYGCRGVGVDLDPDKIEISRRAAGEAGVSHLVDFVREDLHDVSLAEATVVMLYLLDAVNLELRERIRSELRPGSRVVSRRFAMGDWVPDVQIGERNEAIYCWWI